MPGAKKVARTAAKTANFKFMPVVCSDHLVTESLAVSALIMKKEEVVPTSYVLGVCWVPSRMLYLLTFYL